MKHAHIKPISLTHLEADWLLDLVKSYQPAYLLDANGDIVEDDYTRGEEALSASIVEKLRAAK